MATFILPSLLAHSPNRKGEWHRLCDHLRGAAALARRFGEAFGCGDAAEYLALVHDVGKGHCAWRDGLVEEVASRKKVQRPSHREAGTLLAARHLPWHLSGVVDGHHSGLAELADLKTRVAALTKSPGDLEAVIARVASAVPEIGRSTDVAVPELLTSRDANPVAVELLTRMIFSCVVDADWLDTSAHFRPGKQVIRDESDMAVLASRFEERRATKLSRRAPTPLDEVRADIYRQCVEAAEGERGIYRLHVPTGGGKTFAGAGFALHHAAKHGMRRVVVAVPFISITEQNADEYRTLLDPEARGSEQRVVLEHHSSAEFESVGNRWARLAAENWDAPFVVTTTVQLFESLFSNRPGPARKLHRLANSVIILDEVQALPDGLLTPILSILRDLVRHFGATVVLSSATQPQFGALHPWGRVGQREIIAEPAPLFERLSRVQYEWRTGPEVTLASLAQEVAGHEQALVVLNTTKDANRVHQSMEALHPQVLHLSTRMTRGHLREQISEVRSLLEREQPIALVSTSLIEAGVDLDFPRGFRAVTLPESMQQAAGRVNRNGRLKGATMVLFDSVDGGSYSSPSFRTAMAAARSRFGPNRAFPDCLPTLEAYYRHRFRAQSGANATDANGATGEDIEGYRARMNFPKVAELFQMIEENGARVLVVRPELDDETKNAVRAAINELRHGVPSVETSRFLTQHTASIPLKELEEGLRQGHAVQVTDTLHEWTGPYHPARGIEPPNA